MGAVWGSKTLQSFAPNWGEPELLEKTLVGRRELVDRLEQLVIDGAGGPNKHQHLIIGTRGNGKTHVLRVLYNRLRSDKELKKRLLIVYLLEDELGVASYLDLITRMLTAITRSYPKKKALVLLGTQDLTELRPQLGRAGAPPKGPVHRPRHLGWRPPIPLQV